MLVVENYHELCNVLQPSQALLAGTYRSVFSYQYIELQK